MLCPNIASDQDLVFDSFQASDRLLQLSGVYVIEVYAQLIPKWMLRKRGEEFWTVFSMVDTVISSNT